MSFQVTAEDLLHLDRRIDSLSRQCGLDQADLDAEDGRLLAMIEDLARCVTELRREVRRERS
jgi:hypothetical protein